MFQKTNSIHSAILTHSISVWQDKPVLTMTTEHKTDILYNVHVLYVTSPMWQKNERFSALPITGLNVF